MNGIVLLAVLAVQSGQPSLSMAPASYPAASRIPDPQAIGGYGTNNAFPTPIKDYSKSGIWVELKESKTGFSARLGNRSGIAKWFSANDSMLGGWLEAKDEAGSWSPVEYSPWYFCGNSRHRVQLPTNHEWRWEIVFPRGSYRTQIRLHILNDKEHLTSNVLTVMLPKEKFRLDSETSKTMRIRMDWGVPTLVPKDIGGS